ncbi:hypothetical protein ACRQ1B_06040 [Rhizobium panacihumi]|uniref:hypothetical protein n=1 Tax=Rhizobium panacihumi TaxID=2008450 RepID=UPI003D7AB74E
MANGTGAGHQIKEVWKEFGSMINTGLLIAAAVTGIWQGGGWAEATTSAIAKNASGLERLERDQGNKWLAHEQYHKDRISDTKDVQKQTAAAQAAQQADIITLTRKLEVVEYRQSQTEQNVGGLVVTMKDVQGLLANQGGDIKLLLQLAQRQENERAATTRR